MHQLLFFSSQPISLRLAIFFTSFIFNIIMVHRVRRKKLYQHINCYFYAADKPNRRFSGRRLFQFWPGGRHLVRYWGRGQDGSHDRGFPQVRIQSQVTVTRELKSVDQLTSVSWQVFRTGIQWMNEWMNEWMNSLSKAHCRHEVELPKKRILRYSFYWIQSSHGMLPGAHFGRIFWIFQWKCQK